MTFYLNIFSLLAFLPGAAFIHMLMTRRLLKINISSLELVLAGSIIWNYVLIAPSLLLGFFAPYILHYFIIFAIASMGIIILWLYMAMSRKLQISIPSVTLLHVGFFCIPFLFTLIVTVYHPLFLEWDAVSIYLPVAKSIAATGSLFSTYHVSSTVTFIAPGLEITYAWMFFTTQGSYIRLLPFIYFLLTSFTIYLLCRKVLGKYGSLIAVVAFSSMVSTVRILATSSLYTDIAFIFYTSVALYSIIKANDRNSPMFWYCLAGMASTLTMLTKPLGFIVFSLVLSLILLSSGSRFRRVTFVIFASAAFNFFFLWDVFAFRSSPVYLQYTFLRQLPIAILMPPLFFLSHFKKNGNIGRKDIITFLIPIMPILVLVIQNILNLGIVTGNWGPGLAGGTNLDAKLIDFQSVDVGAFFMWHTLFLSIGLGAVYLASLIIGTCSTIYKSYKKHYASSIILTWLIVFTMMWAFFLKNAHEGDSFRNLYYFAPIFSVIIAEGTIVLSRVLGINEKFAFYCFMLFNAVASTYVWARYFGVSVINNLFILRFGIPEMTSICFFSWLFIVIFCAPVFFKWSKVRAWLHRRNVHGNKKKAVFQKIILLSILAFSQIAFFWSVILPLVSYVDSNGWDPNYYNQFLPNDRSTMGVELANISEVIDYYKANITDTYVTVSYFCYYLMYYANRSVIDLGYAYGYQSLAPILSSNDSNILLTKLYDSNIRYFIIPKPSHPMQQIRKTYEQDEERFLLFKEINKNPYFSLKKDFTFYWLYKLVSPEEFQNTIPMKTTLHASAVT
ncbi:MAG: glycosyltransferase family 39 protein [Candidatus Heimdallarchaeota archaeon]